MINWKTSLGGLVTLLAGIVPQFGIELPQDIQVSIIAIGMFIVGLFAKDSNKQIDNETKQ